MIRINLLPTAKKARRGREAGAGGPDLSLGGGDGESQVWLAFVLCAVLL